MLYESSVITTTRYVCVELYTQWWIFKVFGYH